MHMMYRGAKMNAEYKKHGIILLGIIVVICIVSAMVFQNENNNETKVTKGKESEMDVYLLHEDMLLCYPTLSEAKDSSGKIKEIVHYLGQSAASFKALLKEGTQLNQVSVKEGIATLDFEKLKYDKARERKLLESLIFSSTQFADVNAIQISIKGKVLTNMPMNNTPLNETTRSFGINHVDTNQLYLHKGNEVVLYYQRVVDNKKYEVARSIRLNQRDDYNEIMNVILSAPNGSYQLDQPLANKNVIMEKPVNFEDGVLHLYLSKNILASNTKLDKECKEYLVRDFSSFDAIRSLKIHVDKKTYDVIIKK